MSKIERMTDEEKAKISGIIELYPCIQSEGSRAGFPTIAIRTTGCTHRCYFGEVVGVILTIPQFTPKKLVIALMIL